MATIKEKAEILFETKQINALKMIRNKTKSKKRHAALVRVIAIAESELKIKRNKYGI